MAKRVFIAATRQNEGKTTVSLGLLACLSSKVKRVAFMKPVGQRFVEVDGHKIDEDAVLLQQVFGLNGDLQDMSPVAVARRFTREYIDNSEEHKLERTIWSSYRKLDANADFVVIEGTGHAGVGSCFDLSNASVAKLLKSKVLLVTEGGIGKPIDEVMLNRCLFAHAGVEIMGVIMNKVLPGKIDEVEHYARLGLKRFGIDLLGVIPYEEKLVAPTMRQIAEETGGEVINGSEYLDTHVSKTVVGAMTPHQALEYLGKGSLLITAGDREDLILAAMGGCVLGLDRADCVSGMVLTGGIYPHDNIMRLIRKTWVPIVLVREDSYTAAHKIGKLVFKIRPGDKKKISLARRIVNKHVDVDRIAEIAMAQVVD